MGIKTVTRSETVPEISTAKSSIRVDPHSLAWTLGFIWLRAEKMPMVTAYSHERSEECNRPQGHEYDPYDDCEAKLRCAEDLQVEEGYGRLDKSYGENACHDE